MQAEVISIGDELTSGQRLDTNSQWISQRLGEIGVPVVYHTTVADDLEANIRVFRQAVERADLVIASGGLGPTADDLTREVLAQVAGVELEFHADVLAHIEELFRRFGRNMPERNRVQALFPVGSRVIPNPNGTAPGIDLAVPRPGRGPSRIFALPGVPAELFEMWSATVAPAIAESVGGGRAILHRRIKVFGAGESHVEQMLPDMIRRGRDPLVGITVSGAVITLRITALGANAEECLAKIEPTVETIRQSLGDLIFGEEEDELEHAVGTLLAARSLRLAVAEWGTAGQVTSWLAEVPAARPYLAGSVVAHDATSLVRLLGMPGEVLEQHPGASAAVAESMAIHLREKLDADLALATSAVPTEEASGGEVGRIYFALASDQEAIVRSTQYAGHHSILRVRAARQALNLVRLALVRGTVPNA